MYGTNSIQHVSLDKASSLGGLRCPDDIAYAKNVSGTTIPKYSLVILYGWSAPEERYPGTMNMRLADSTLQPTGKLYMVSADTAHNSRGFLVSVPVFPGNLDTSSSNLGANVYLGTSGMPTLTAPTLGQPRIVGFVSSVGTIADGGNWIFYPGQDAQWDASLPMPATKVATFTNAEVKALRATPGTVIPAPGAGKYIRVLDHKAFLDYGGTAYTIAAGTDDLQLKYDNGAGRAAFGVMESAGLIDATADAAAFAAPVANSGSLASIVNKAVVLHNVGGAEYGAGHADNVLRNEVRYEVCSSPL